MPLYADGLRKIRRNLLQVQSGQKPRVAKVGYFTPEQIAIINEARASMGLPALRPEILFHGSHLYKSRCIKDRYTIDQVLLQIQSALSHASVVDPSPPSVVIRNPNKRVDHNGKLVNDGFDFIGAFICSTLYAKLRLEYSELTEQENPLGTRREGE
jgi:hypothetical protein